MEVWRLRTLLVFLILSRLFLDMTRSENSERFHNLPRLKDLCPYSNFCGLNASKEYQLDDNKIPCCQSCSCTPDCGYHGNCCYSRLNEYSRVEEDSISMVCRNAYEIDPEEGTNYNSLIYEPVPYYWIVNKCSSMNEDLRLVSGELDYKNKTFAPVLSSNTGTIYYNSYFAMCNNVSDVIPWQRILLCPDIAMATLSDLMDEAIGPPGFQECLSYFLPPENEVNYKRCYKNVIRQCNFTGQMSTKNDFWPLCGMFNSTFISTTHTYANVYCYICNTENEGVLESIMRSTKCDRFNDISHKNPLTVGTALTIILNLGQRARETSNFRQEDKCGPNHYMVNSFKTSCRSIRCPTGQILFNGACDFYSDKWIGGPFVVMLRLSPMYKRQYLRTKILEDFIIRNDNNKRANWILRKTLKRWHIVVFYYSSENISHVEYIIVKAVYPFRLVNPKVLIGSVKKALQDVWTIKHLNSTFSFQVGFNEFQKYTRLRKSTKVSWNVTREHYLPQTKHVCGDVPSEDFEYQNTLYSVANIDGKDLNRWFFLTKMFFCHQIELLPEEFEFSPHNCVRRIFFKVKNVIMHTFTALPTMVYVHGKYNLKTVNRVFVCLHAFGITTNNNIRLCINTNYFIVIISLKLLII